MNHNFECLCCTSTQAMYTRYISTSNMRKNRANRDIRKTYNDIYFAIFQNTDIYALMDQR